MTFDFETVIERLGTGSSKWSRYAPDVTPMWVADMDFPPDPGIIAAIRERLDHPMLGYGIPTDDLRDTLVNAMLRDHGWSIEPDALVFLPGVEPGFNMALRAFLEPGDGVVLETPVYRPLLVAPEFWRLRRVDVPLQPDGQGRWSSDPAHLERAAARAKALLLCNPQNPTGRVMTRSEIEGLAEICLRNDLVVISDEIHCGLALDGREHVPIASLSSEIGKKTITLMAASKTWNIAGLKAAFAIVPDAEIRSQFAAARSGLVDSVNILGLVAMKYAFANGEKWRKAVTLQLAKNRDLLQSVVRRVLPEARMFPAEGSFLGWADFGRYDLSASPHKFFLENARVALSDGAEFGVGYEDWARINFGCPPAILRDSLERMEKAVKGINQRNCGHQP
ncbi:MAG: PatB family C-S lyase [Albidovulum sp.]|nr:PatB family C-S lyase [Albidovulum sp.]MDE0530640.1 PatB family C-S lyase [Albidovulum sp.]